MVEINEEAYPIVFVYFEGEITAEDTKNYLSSFNHWLDRASPFGLIIQEKNTGKHPDHHRAIIQWTKPNKPQIAKWCVGMAIVIDSPQILEERKARKPKSTESLFGCPGEAFATYAEAEAWIKSQLLHSQKQ